MHSLLRRELSSTPSVPSHSIILAGFGQGGALALHAGLTFDRPLAGILSLAGFLPVRESYPENIHPSQRGTPILAIHGNSDFIVPLAFAKLGYDRLKQAKQPILVKTEWAMGHFMRSDGSQRREAHSCIIRGARELPDAHSSSLALRSLLPQQRQLDGLPELDDACVSEGPGGSRCSTEVIAGAWHSKLFRNLRKIDSNLTIRKAPDGDA